ncbi:NUDIX hydrolase [Candidatus Pacearchaeota archaeon]|nr:NUDIX hydrolase [Candidatus Pacearchaeota archaeon]
MIRHTPFCTVDIIVPYNHGIVLIQRKNEPFKDHWALPGGFLDSGETLEEAACRELREETTLETIPSHLILIGNYSHPDRDPRGHVISHVYLAQHVSGMLRAQDDAKAIKIFRRVPEKMAFDHRQIIEEFIRKHQIYTYLLSAQEQEQHAG